MSLHIRKFSAALSLGGGFFVGIFFLSLAGAIPFLAITLISFTSLEAYSASSAWVGTSNYRELMVDDGFMLASLNTLIYAVASAIAQISLGFAQALVVSRWKGKIVRVVEAILFVPYVVIPSAVVVQIWKFLGDYRVGLIPVMGRKLTGVDIALFSPDLVRFTLVLVSTWMFAPFSMIIILARLRQIQPSLYEVLTLDGAGPWSCFRNITWPHVRGAVATLFVLRLFIMATKFDVPYLILGSGALSTKYGPLSIFIFEASYEKLRYGFASAAAVLLAVPLFSVIFALRKRPKEYS